MKKIVFPIVVIIICFSTNTNAQVIQKKADKWQLVNGVKLESRTSKTNLIKLKPTKVSTSVNSQNTDDVPKKNDKNVKPPKVLKYGNQKSSKVKMISPTTVVPNTTKTKVEESKKYKLEYQKKIKTKEVEDE